VPATNFRYTFAEGVQVINNLVQQYNAEPQMGHLKGLSPNEAFLALADKTIPHGLHPELGWMLANERYRVPVEMSGCASNIMAAPSVCGVVNWRSV